MGSEKNKDIKKLVDGVEDIKLQPVNYDILKGEFIIGEYPTVAMFARAKGIDKHELAKHSRGWHAERDTYIENITEKITERDMERRVLTASNIKYIRSDMVIKMKKQWEEIGKEILVVKEELADEESRKVYDRAEIRKSRLNALRSQQRVLEGRLATLLTAAEKSLGDGRGARDEEQKATELQRLRDGYKQLSVKFMKPKEGKADSTEKKTDTA